MSAEKPHVSIVMPAFNVASYIAPAIQSVIDQSYPHWELWIVNHNSTDQTVQVIEQFTDPRIHLIHSSAPTLSSVRNLALKKCTGDFVCFLDADDLLPPTSLQSRVEFLVAHPHISFVDGQVITKSHDLSKTLRLWQPSFQGMPLYEMTKLDAKCFCGVTWMIRRIEGIPLEFDESVHYLEDRWMYLCIAKQGLYDYVNQPIYIIRKRPNSMMHHLPRLEEGYRQFMYRLDMLPGQKTADKMERNKTFHLIFFKSYLKTFRFGKAIAHGLSYLRIPSVHH